MSTKSPSQIPSGQPNEEDLEIHPTFFQRILALLGVIALIGLFRALLYLIRRMA